MHTYSKIRAKIGHQAFSFVAFSFFSFSVITEQASRDAPFPEYLLILFFDLLLLLHLCSALVFVSEENGEAPVGRGETSEEKLLVFALVASVPTFSLSSLGLEEEESAPFFLEREEDAD